VIVFDIPANAAIVVTIPVLIIWMLLDVTIGLAILVAIRPIREADIDIYSIT